MKNFATEVVMIDIKENLADGKAVDLMQTASLNGFDTKITGTTGDYSKTADSQVVVITSGVPRKPGMTREELLGVNAGIVKSVVSSVLQYSPDAIIVVVANPMDTITYLVHKVSGLPKHRIIGMGGALDSARFKCRLAEVLGCPTSDVDGMVIAAHSDTGMLPLVSKATYRGVPVTEFLSEEQINYVIEETKIDGAKLTKLLGTSAWYGTGAAVAVLVQSIICDQKKMIPCSIMLDGEYGEKDICTGVPAIIGANGVEKIVQIPLTEDEKEKFANSTAAVRKVNMELAAML